MAGEAAAMARLIRAQRKILPKALEELKNGAKETHWMWYLCPTDYPGQNDRYKTYLSRDNALEFLQQAPDIWQETLEYISLDKSWLTLSKLDLARVKDFIFFWLSLTGIPQWLENICWRLMSRFLKNK